ncbi:hypothetical protein DHEL01_v211815 [Diaporthe helianthi]|uniref:C2H2-type domain-containing protein n=1 Tax=Diaporthe helianthi TaxID=158607 RepID=A0A2P5HHQ8_DIAHE|nr:hypothetical protein DHEL01_v211815 [Diaporthe helianthi]
MDDPTAAATASATLAFVISQTWKCLCEPATGKNGIFKKVFFEEEILTEVATAANLTFCPGLLDVVRSPTPPDISFFKSTPSKHLGLWGVYCLVLEKPGRTPLVYIGEASQSGDGIRNRWRAYDNPTTYRKLLHSKVKNALDDGFKIVHKGVLSWCPIPGAKNLPRFRLLNYSVEAMFSFLFWAMFPKTGEYQIGSCCLWPRGSFTYGGLCSHSPLNDLMRANIKLSAEELEQLASENAELQRLQAKARQQARYDSKKWYCPDCEQPCATPAELKNHNNSPKHKRRLEKIAAGVDFDEHRCPVCDKGFAAAYDLETHEESDKHKNEVAALIARGGTPPQSKPRDVKRRHRRTKAEIAAQKLYCPICELRFKKPSEVTRHNTSKRHKSRAADVAAGIDVNKYRCPFCQFSAKDARAVLDHERTDAHKANVAAQKKRGA